MGFRVRSFWQIGFVQEIPHRIVGAAQRESVERRIVDRRIGDHFRRHHHFQDFLAIEGLSDLGGAGQYRSVGMNKFQVAAVDLLFRIERAAANFFDLTLDQAHVPLFACEGR
jgi:hypothetical protein